MFPLKFIWEVSIFLPMVVVYPINGVVDSLGFKVISCVCYRIEVNYLTVIYGLYLANIIFTNWDQSAQFFKNLVYIILIVIYGSLKSPKTSATFLTEIRRRQIWKLRQTFDDKMDQSFFVVITSKLCQSIFIDIKHPVYISQ